MVGAKKWSKKPSDNSFFFQFNLYKKIETLIYI